MNPKDIIFKYYIPETPLTDLLLCHSEAVARKALKCIEARNIDTDEDFIYEAAMLHDIGIFRCNAPSIHCTGTLPYICHGVEGRKILEAEGLPLHALVCERHTGSGLPLDYIIQKNLPIPHRDMCPQSLPERLVCYADKFFSKSDPRQEEKPFEEVEASMARFGEDSLRRFLDLHREFGY